MFLISITLLINRIKWLFPLILLLQLSQFSIANAEIYKIMDTTKMNPNYDEELAKKLGGDDYGMKSYFFVILTTGKNTTEPKEKVSEYFRGHLDNINRLVQEKKLIVAGPLSKNEKNYRGLFIFENLKTKEELESILQTDPAIKNELLDFEIFTWYGSAALREYLPFSDKIWKSKP